MQERGSDSAVQSLGCLRASLGEPVSAQRADPGLQWRAGELELVSQKPVSAPYSKLSIPIRVSHLRILVYPSSLYARRLFLR